MSEDFYWPCSRVLHMPPRHSWIPRWSRHEARGLPADDKGVDLASQLCLGRREAALSGEARPQRQGTVQLSLRDLPFPVGPGG